MKNNTKCLEIIELRTGTSDTDKLESVLQTLVESFSDGNNRGKIKIYRRFALQGDYSIHLLYRSNKPGSTGSPLGLHLVASLKQFGLSNRQIWHEMKFYSNQI